VCSFHNSKLVKVIGSSKLEKGRELYFFPQLQVLLLHSRKYAPIGVGESTTAWFLQFIHEYLTEPLDW
jgi:hypothetical protein